MAMQKVQSYIKNLGKSVKYASVDVLREMAPSTAEFTTTNADLFKQISYVVRERRQMIQRTSRLIKQSKIYEAGNEYKKSLFEDIKSGNFYNKERKEAFNIKAMGSLADFDMPDIDIDMGDSFDSDGDIKEFDISDGDNFLADTIESNSIASASMISDTVARSSEYIVENQRAMNEFNMLQSHQHFTNITNVMKTINDNISKTITFNDQAQRIHIENSKKFYEETTKVMRENNALLKELVEMERNRYNNERNNSQESNNKNRLDYNDMTAASGVPNLKAYFENVMKNINNKLGSIGGMSDAFGEDSNILLTFAASPLEAIPKLFVSNLINKNLKSSITRLDKSISSFFSALITRFNTMATSENNIIQAIGEIFGARNRLTTQVDTSKYNKGPVPWDGKARQALVEVIPAYLSKLVALQSGTAEMIYDYNSGKFTSGKEVKQKHQETIDSAVKSATREIRETMEETLNKSFAFNDLQSRKTFDEDMTKFFNYFFNNGEMFDYRRKSYDEYDKIGLSSEDNYKLIRDLFASMPRHQQMQFYRDIMSGRDSLTKTISSYETEDSIYRYTNNNFGLNEYFDDKGNFKSGKIKGVGSNSDLIETKDKYGNNVFFYLNKIAKTLLEGIIVYPSGGSYSGTSGPNIIPPSLQNRLTDFDNSYNKEIFLGFNTDARNDERFREKETERAKKNNLVYVDDLYSRDSKLTAAGVIQTQRDYEKTKGDIQKRQNKGELDEFIQDLMDSSSLYDKYKAVSGRIQKVMEAPGKALSKVVDRVDLRLFEIIYGKDEKEYRGETVKGFIDMIMVDLRNTFDKFNTWLDEKIITPLSERIGGVGSKLMDGILTGLGINMTSSEMGSKIKTFFFGEKDDDGDYISKGIISDFSDQVRSDFNAIKMTLVGKNSTLRKIYRLIKEYTIDTTRHNQEGQFDLLFNIEVEVKKFKSSMQEDIRIAKSIKENIDKMSRDNLQEVIMNIYDLLKAGGYDVDNSTLNDLKQTFKIAKDYVFGENTVIDRMDKIISTGEFSNMSTIFHTDNTKLNPNKFYSLINALRQYLNQSSFSGKVTILDKIAREISNINAENDDEIQLKKYLHDTYLSYLSKLNADNADDLAIDLLNKIKSYIPGTGLSNIINLYTKIKSATSVNTTTEAGKAINNINNASTNGATDAIQTINNVSSIINTGNDKKDGNNAIDAMNDFISGLKPDGTHAEGIKRVPFDNYHAVLHKDERVLTKEEADRLEAILNSTTDTTSFKTGSGLDKNQSIYGKLESMLNSFNPQTEADAMAKENIRKILDTFTGNNIDEILNQVMQETNKNRELRGVAGKKTLLENVIQEFNTMFSTTKKALFGSDKEEDIEKDVSERITKGLDEATKDVFTNIKQYIPKMGSAALLGAGVGILPGVIGGPLMWAGVGASAALIKNSEKVQNYLFGTIKDGKRQDNGLISRKTAESVEKYAPDVKKYGLMGAALSIIPGTPFGLVGGMILGTATAFAKNNAGVQNFLFGDSGIVGKDAKKKVEKFIPKAVMATILTGIGTKVAFGSAFGPFGVVGGIAMGSALALFSHTNKFQEMLFGKKDKNGKHKGGLFSFVRETFLDAKYFVMENMLKPLAHSIAPLRKEIGILAKGFAKKTMGFVDFLFEKIFGTKLSKFTGQLFNILTFIPKHLAKGIKFLGEEIVASPFKFLTYLTDSLRIKHAQSDNPNDYSYMTEEERQEILAKKGFGRFLKTMSPANTKRRKRNQEDEETEETKSTKKIVDAVSESSDKTVEEIKRSNTTLNELASYVAEIGRHIGAKITDRISINKDEETADTDKSSDTKTNSALNNNAQQTIDNIDKKSETASVLTPEGEVELERDRDGVLVPSKDSKVYKKLKKEETNDNTWQKKLLNAITGKKSDEEGEEGEEKKGGMLSNISSILTSFAPKLLTLLPALLIALPVLPDIVKGIGKVLNYLGNSGVGQEGNAEEGEMEGSGLASGVIETVEQTHDDKGRIMFNIAHKGTRAGIKTVQGAVDKGKKVVSGTKKAANVIKNVSQKGLKEGIKAADKAADVAKAVKVADAAADVAKGASIFKKVFNIFKSEKVIKIIGKEAAEAMLKVPAQLSKIAGKQLIGTIGKKLVKLLGPIGVALSVYDLVWGMTNAEEVLEMVGNLPFGVKLIAGLVNVLNNQFTLGLIPKKWLLSTVIKLLPGDAIDQQIAEGQAELKKMYETYSKTAIEPVEFEDYTKNYKRYNKQVGLPTESTKPKTETSGINTYGRFKYGRGVDEIQGGSNTTFPFYSQKDSRWSNKLYNVKGDKVKQTIGDSGCGPTSAAMVVTALTGEQVTPDEAANFAVSNNYKEPDGGTYPEFFTNFSKRYGIKSTIRNLNGQDRNIHERNIENEIQQNIPTILMGKSESNNDRSTPFGKNPHYVVATGVNNSNKVIIHDPSSKEGGKLFDLRSTLKKATLGISSIFKGKGYEGTQGEEAFINIEGMPYGEDEPSLIQKLFEKGSNLLRKLFGLPDTDQADKNYRPAKQVKLTSNNFVQSITSSVLSAAKTYGILPSIIMAQAILESGWGSSAIGNNLFGIKAGSSWKGKTRTVVTTEYVNGVARKITAKFRDYDTIDESILDHSKLLSGTRYKKVRNAKNYKEAAYELYKAGYATDPNYPEKLIDIIESNGLYNLDDGNYSTSNIRTASSNSTGKLTGQTNIHSWLLDRLRKLSEDNGNRSIYINSGYRTLAKQTELWNEHKRKYPNMSDKERNKWVANPKNNPGSMHLLGLAADISTPWVKNMSKNELAKYGIWRPLGNEPWHFEAVETGYPNNKASVKSTLRGKYGTPDNPKHNPVKPLFGLGKDAIFDVQKRRDPKIEKIDVDKYLYGTDNPSISTSITSSMSTPSTISRSSTMSSPTAVVGNNNTNNLLVELIKLIVQIVQNTNNLSEIVKILSEGLNIKIPQEKLKTASPAVITNLLTQNRTDEGSNYSEMINMLGKIAAQ